ncbi:hypothetical protein [Winogradskyella sp. PE311]|uniref:hypothetical protein n=1 Tax=Winogradskyella sp. PE311 TaxID=3366943 RepID=UPI0039818562
MVYLTNYFKVIGEHNKALIVQALLLISFISIVVFIVFIEDVVLAFFLGKAIGLFIALVILGLYNLLGFSFSVKFLNKEELKNVMNLFSVSALGWLSGLGFLNLAKIYSSAEELVKIGYILNIFNVFLLLSIGINSIYAPVIKKHLQNQNNFRALKIKTKTLLGYLLVAILTFAFYLVISSFDFGFNERVVAIISIIPFVILIYMFNAFNWVSQPFYLVNNKFKNYNLINLLSYGIWILVLVGSIYSGYKNFIIYLILIHFIKSVLSFMYAKKYFMNKNYIP